MAGVKINYNNFVRMFMVLIQSSTKVLWSACGKEGVFKLRPREAEEKREQNSWKDILNEIIAILLSKIFKLLRQMEGNSINAFKFKISVRVNHCNCFLSGLQNLAKRLPILS